MKAHDGVAFFRAEGSHIAIVEEDTAVRGFMKSRDQSKQSALPATARAEKKEQFTGVDLQIDAVERRCLAELFVDVFEAYGCHRGGILVDENRFCDNLDEMKESDQPQIVAEGRHIRLMTRGSWEYAARKNISGIVGILAVTDEGKILLVEQPRPPLGKNVIEIPAGLAGDVVGHETEALSQAARRELLEETGYDAAGMEWISEGAVSAGITDEIIALFRATGLTKKCEALGDGSEQITLHEVPLANVEVWLDEQRGAGLVIDLKVYTALYFARREMR